MTIKTKPIPAGYHTVTPYLVVTNAVYESAATGKGEKPWLRRR